MKKIDLIYKKIKAKILDYDERIEKGDIFVVHSSMLNKNLTPNEILYLSAYYSYYKNINKADKYMKNIVSNQTLMAVKKKLNNLGYIKIIINTPEELKKQTIKLSHKGEKCEWCGKSCYILQEHHFPISAKNGGEKTIKICPNCHYTFHKLESEKYE